MRSARPEREGISACANGESLFARALLFELTLDRVSRHSSQQRPVGTLRREPTFGGGKKIHIKPPFELHKAAACGPSRLHALAAEPTIGQHFDDVTGCAPIPPSVSKKMPARLSC
jgi:hypothetical protein